MSVAEYTPLTKSSDPELVHTAPRRCCSRNVAIASSLAISVLVAAAILVAVLFAAVPPSPRGRLLSLEEATNGIGIKRRDVRFVQSDSYAFSNDSKIFLVELETLKESILIDLAAITWQEFTKLWRRSGFSTFLVADVASQSVRRVGLTPTAKQSSCTWSPKSNIVACSENYNVIVQDFDANSPAVAITTDGSWGNMIYGIQSWVYEEEVFEEATALWWSPSGDTIAFISFNESLVNTFSFPLYGDVAANPYQKTTDIKYPLPGFNNPIPSVGYYNLTSQQLQWATLSTGYPVEYINHVGFKSATELTIRTLDRPQQLEVLHIVSTADGQTHTAVVTQSVTNGWAKWNPNPIMWVSESAFVTIRNNSNYYHIAQISTTGAVRFLTNGPWDVLSINGFNKDTKTLFYISSQVSPLEKHLYRVSIDSGEIDMLTSSPGTYSATFNNRGAWFVLDQLGPDVPAQYLYKAGPEAKSMVTLEDNAALRQKLRDYALPKKEYIKIPVNGRELNAYIMKPPTFGGARRHPVLFNLYQGPYSQQVSLAFALGYNEYVSGKLGVIVVMVDGIGTAARGVAWEQATYRQLGLLETEDQIAAMNYVKNTFGFVDATRLGLWGWSYGGFMTLSILSESKNLLRTAVSVAPVTDWRMYDSAYTERFMSTPMDNPQGYNATSLMQRCKQIQSRFLLVHGLADDNVHFANSAEVALQLINAGVQFDTMYYPNNDHSINSNGARLHLNEYLTRYFKLNLVD